jgi:UrcA family protein
MSQARVIGFFSTYGGSAMTRSNFAHLLHRAPERVSSAAAAIALTFLTLLAVDARADEPKGNPPSVTVRFSDLALADTPNAAKVYGKLRDAARKVCGVDRGAKSLETYIAQRECFDAALAEAVRKIDRPTLTALHDVTVRKLG